MKSELITNVEIGFNCKSALYDIPVSLEISLFSLKRILHVLSYKLTVSRRFFLDLKPNFQMVLLLYVIRMKVN